MEKILMRLPDLPAESGGGKPRVRLEFCGEIEHGTVSELSCDAFDGPVSLGQQ